MEIEWTGRRGLERLQIPSASTFWTAAQLATRPERVRAAQGTTNFNNIKKNKPKVCRKGSLYFLYNSRYHSPNPSPFVTANPLAPNTRQDNGCANGGLIFLWALLIHLPLITRSLQNNWAHLPHSDCIQPTPNRVPRAVAATRPPTSQSWLYTNLWSCWCAELGYIKCTKLNVEPTKT